MAVVGGSVDYTGAPYYAAISALRAGADLASVFCHPLASQAIKCYSPELMVSPILLEPVKLAASIQPMTSIVIGPGLGREK